MKKTNIITCPHCNGTMKLKHDGMVIVPLSESRKGTKQHVLRRKEWTKVEDQFLQEFYQSLPIRELVKKLNRTKCAVFGRARILGLMNPPEKEISYDEFLKNMKK